jgi:phosphoribosylanthranilate isomerase
MNENDRSGANWTGRDTMLTAIAQVGQAVVQLHGPLPEDVAEALRALMRVIQQHG